jgi:hypothetical protein
MEALRDYAHRTQHDILWYTIKDLWYEQEKHLHSECCRFIFECTCEWSCYDDKYNDLIKKNDNDCGFFLEDI